MTEEEEIVEETREKEKILMKREIELVKQEDSVEKREKKI